MRKALWLILGLFFVGCAYIGIILPGVPTTFFVILAAWAFSKSSEKFNKWIHEHKLFGKYLTNWETKRIYPYRGSALFFPSFTHMHRGLKVGKGDRYLLVFWLLGSYD